MSLRKNNSGFTLIEVLIALFVFTIISMIMVSALHSVLNAQSATEKNAAGFNQLQLTLILLQRDLEQTIERPVSNAANVAEPALSGTTSEISFTHAGFANPFGALTRSTLQRTHYFIRKEHLIRETWPQLDITHDTASNQRDLLSNVTELHFQYLDKEGKFQNYWPALSQNQAGLPYAVRVVITLKTLGKISQLYVIPGQPLAKQN